MPVYARKEILDMLDETEPERRLVITPLLDRKRQVTLNGVDVRLGNEFVVIQQSNLPSIDPAAKGLAFAQNLGRYQQKVRINFGEEFVLHPGQLVLGCTLEYIGLPESVCGQILGRSSWGRLGLISATAPFISAGFKGVITLELENLGQIPLEVYPGYLVAQLVLQDTSSIVPYAGKYDHPTSVEFTKLMTGRDKEEMPFWSDPKSFG